MMERLEDCISFLIGKAAQQVTRRAREILAPYGVTPVQYAVLKVLWEADGRSGAELGARLVLDSASITGVVDRLEKHGLVERTRPKHDRRVQFIELTDAGMSEFKRMARHHERWIDELLGGMSVEDMQRLQRLLIKTRASVSTTLSCDALNGENRT